MRHGEKVKLGSDVQFCDKMLNRQKEEIQNHSLTHSLTFANGSSPAVCPLHKPPNTTDKKDQVLLRSK